MRVFGSGQIPRLGVTYVDETPGTESERDLNTRCGVTFRLRRQPRLARASREGGISVKPGYG